MMAAARADALTESWQQRIMPGWRRHAACIGRADVFWHPKRTDEAQAICNACPVRLSCLVEAANEEADLYDRLITPLPVRGGLTGRQRAALADNRCHTPTS